MRQMPSSLFGEIKHGARLAARLEGFSRLEFKADSRKAFVEILHGHGDNAACWVVENCLVF